MKRDLSQSDKDVSASKVYPAPRSGHASPAALREDRVAFWAVIVAALTIICFVIYTISVGLLFKDEPIAYFLLGAGLYVTVMTLVVVACLLGAKQRKMSDILISVFLASIVYFILFGIGLPPAGLPDKAREAETKQNVNVIDHVLRRYAADHDGCFPDAVDDRLVQYGLTKMPHNPLADPPREMRQVSFGAEEPWGDFSYIPYEQDGAIVGYYLLGYGSKNTYGMDVQQNGERDHVIIVFCSTDPALHTSEFAGQPEPPDIPPLSSLLQNP